MFNVFTIYLFYWWLNEETLYWIRQSLTIPQILTEFTFVLVKLWNFQFPFSLRRLLKVSLTNIQSLNRFVSLEGIFRCVLSKRSFDVLISSAGFQRLKLFVAQD